MKKQKHSITDTKMTANVNKAVFFSLHDNNENRVSKYLYHGGSFVKGHPTQWVLCGIKSCQAAVIVNL